MIGLHECPTSPASTPPRPTVAAGGGGVGGGGSGGVGGSGAGAGTGGGNSARERAALAVDYYNNTVLRARVNAGLAAPRASYNDRHHHHGSAISAAAAVAATGSRRHHLAQESLYRSNSSLELQDHHHHHIDQTSPTLRREYGSHGSIDVIANERPGPSANTTGTSESFFAMLQDYRPAVLSVIGTDQRSPGPSEYLRGKTEQGSTTGCASTSASAGTPPSEGPGCSSTNSSEDGASGGERAAASGSSGSASGTSSSPKLRLKLHRLWGGSGGGGQANVASNMAKPLRQSSAVDDSVVSSSTANTSNVASTSADIEERQRRRAFAHFDCQSLTANLGYAAKLRGLLLARRRNTTTGASAASMLNTRSATPDGDSGDEDSGDGQCNDLLENCPFFRNEVGGEQERVVSLTRVQPNQTSPQRRAIHRPPLAYGVAVLEFPSGETHWRHATCPYQRLPKPIETVDTGALYYRHYFCAQDHQNWFGMDEQLGPVAISIKRERVSNDGTTANHQFQYRLIIRTSELLTLRGAILEDAIPNLKTSSSNKSVNTKEVLEYVAPEIQLNCLRLGVQSPQAEEQLLKLDEQGLTSHYKVGIMYCKAGQASEEEMYNNEDAGPAFLEFLDCIGQRVRLKGFDKYKAGLDNKTDSTGMYSVYAQYQECEIMFHVSTMLPFTPNNRQQLLRKRHIGNDIVTIVFQEPGAQPFTPKNIRSQFQHVFIVVRAINPCTENTHYSVAVSRSKEVPVFGPPIKEGAVFPKSKTFADFLLAKVVNAENAAHRSEKFATMATRTRQEYLKDLATNYTTTTMVETGQKFSIFSSKKKEKPRPAFIGDASQRGAICWQVILDDSGQSKLVECFLGISTDTLVLIEECSRQIVFVTPCKAVLGWAAQTNSLKMYHHQGECTTIHMRESNADRDELMEIMERLRAVTPGIFAQELSLRRNPMGQLGFHVQPDGVVTQVESMGLAWHAGLRQGSRLVEICKVAVSTLTHDQMVDLLKTSILVTVTVVPPLPDNQPRRGCNLQNCRFNAPNFEGDYENLNPDENKTHRKSAQHQQPVPGNHRRRCERSFSPPRSSNSSGYGTGSSSKSFLGPDSRFPVNPEGTMTSSSSGHSSDDRWYELLETPDFDTGIHKGSTPPPLPARIAQNSLSAFQNVTPKRNVEAISHPSSQIQMVQNHTHHNHNSPSAIQHNKIQVSHSLPLPHASFSLPLNNHNSHYNDYDNDLKDKVPCMKTSVNDSRPLPRTANIEYLVTRAPKIAEYTTLNHNLDMKSSLLPMNDGHSTDTSSMSDKIMGLPSEDELSAGSGNVSPRMRRASKHRGGQLTPSSNNSRNHSPRPVNGETRLRPGVTPRSNRNSANLSSSTLQEDLMKLINPDYMSEETNEHTQTNGLNGIDHGKHRSRSRENINTNLSVHQNNHSNSQAEVIFTMARPATVISNASTASSPAPSEFKLTKEERLSPRVTSNSHKNKMNMGSEPLPLPDAGDMDWPSLVDTATRAMLQVQDDLENVLSAAVLSVDHNGHWDDKEVNDRLGIDASITSTVSSSASVPELQSHLSELESRVSFEARRRKSLEDEVRRLREENRRLQDESQAAAHQLRKFTEWFFQTIDRQ